MFGQLKYESGVHRVQVSAATCYLLPAACSDCVCQRVPLTETSGRIHTSTITVAVLPEPDEVASNFVKLDESELKVSWQTLNQCVSRWLQFDVYRASGAGGQHVLTCTPHALHTTVCT